MRDIQAQLLHWERTDVVLIALDVVGAAVTNLHPLCFFRSQWASVVVYVLDGSGSLASRNNRGIQNIRAVTRNPRESAITGKLIRRSGCKGDWDYFGYRAWI